MSDTIWHVCSATRAAIVNLAPIFNDGPERCRKIIILKGVANPNAPTEVEREEAMWPARELREALVLAGFATEVVEEVTATPADFDAWRKHGLEIGRDAKNANARIVFNLKGGLKEMAIGGLIGLQQSGAEILPVTVEGAREGVPLRIVAVGAAPAPLRTPLSLDLLLSVYGLRQLAREQADWFQEQVCTHAELAKELARAITLNWTSDELIGAINQLSESITDFDAEVLRTAFDHRGREWSHTILLDDAIDRIAQSFNVFASAVWGRTGTKVTSDQVKLLRGGWLDLAVFLSLRDALPTAEVRLGVEVADMRSVRPRDATGEFDVLIVADGQVSVVECKSGYFGTVDGGDNVTSAKAVLAKLSTTGRRFVGDFGRIAVITPRPPTGAPRAKVQRVQDAADRLTYSIYRGFDALSALTADFVGFIAEGGGES